LRILLTVHQFFPKYTYGTERVTLDTGRELLARGHEVYVLTTDRTTHSEPHNEVRDYEYAGLKVRLITVDMRRTPDPLRYEFDNPQMAERMREYVREIEPDIVHVIHAGRLSGSIIPAAKEFELPVVFTATDFWSVCRVIHLKRADTGALCTGPDRIGMNCMRCYLARMTSNQTLAESSGSALSQPPAASYQKRTPNLPSLWPRLESPEETYVYAVLRSLRRLKARLLRYSKVLRAKLWRLRVRLSRLRARSFGARSAYILITRPKVARVTLKYRFIRLLQQSDAALRAYIALSRFPWIRDKGYLHQPATVTDRIGYLRDAVNKADRVIAPTKLTRDVLIRNGIDPRRITLSHYGMDVASIAAASWQRKPSNRLRVGYIGALAPHKGVDVIIRAFSDLPEDVEAELKIYGSPSRDPEYFGKLEKLVGKNERMIFAGTFEQEETGKVLSEMDVLVVPSRWYENTPLVVYAAMAAGVPVVATDLGGLSEIVEHENNGLLFKMGNVKELRNQLMRLISEPELLEKLRSGIGKVRTVEDSVEELEKIYADLVRPT
jgi:glycosyltransferase involved in cell wall biosynthesis